MHPGRSQGCPESNHDESNTGKDIFQVSNTGQINHQGKYKTKLAFSYFGNGVFLSGLDNTIGYCIGLLIAFLIMTIVASQFVSVWDVVKQHSIAEKTLCLFSAAGICLGNQEHFYRKMVSYFGASEKINILIQTVSYFGAICVLFLYSFFVFFCLLFFWKEIKHIVYRMGLGRDVNWKECLIPIQKEHPAGINDV